MALHVLFISLPTLMLGTDSKRVDLIRAEDKGNRMRGKPWLHLLSYCIILVLASSLLFGGLLASVSLAFGLSPDSSSQSQDASPITVSGVISDSHCGAKHATESGNVPAQCTRVCARRGAKYVVVNGDTTYVLVGSVTTFDAFAGQRAQVNGTLAGDILKVTSIRAQ
jgi:hypothetical protein